MAYTCCSGLVDSRNQVLSTHTIPERKRIKGVSLGGGGGGGSQWLVFDMHNQWKLLSHCLCQGYRIQDTGFY